MDEEGGDEEGGGDEDGDEEDQDSSGDGRRRLQEDGRRERMEFADEICASSAGDGAGQGRRRDAAVYSTSYVLVVVLLVMLAIIAVWSGALLFALHTYYVWHSTSVSQESLCHTDDDDLTERTDLS